MRWFERSYWVCKVLGVSMCAALSASTLTTLVTARLLSSFEAFAAGDAATEEDASEAAAEPDEAEPVVAATRPAAVDRSGMIESIVGRGLFCPSCARPAVKPEDDQPPADAADAKELTVADLAGARPCTLPLRLVATMEAGATAWATIRDAESGSVGPFGPAEMVRPGVALVSVERGRVFLRHQDALEVLYLGAEPPPPPKPTPAKPTREAKAEVKESLPGMNDAVRCDSEHACTISRDFVDSLFGNPTKLMGQARVAPAVRDGESRGFEFRGVKRDSLPQVLGIANGDIVTSVNGNSLQSIDQVMGLVTKMRRASNLSITLERKGVVITKEIEIR